jgi:uncharacterized membrane protein
MDRPIKFFVLVIPSERMGEFKDLQRRQWSEEEIGKLRIGYVKLELVPRGTGRLLVRAQQLYFSINSAGAVDMTIELVNEGSRRLDDVEINADLPLNWSKAIEPAVINALDIGEEKKVHLHFTTPQEIGVGRYDIRLRTSGLTDNQPVTGEDKTVTVEVQAQASILGTLLLVILILGLVAGMVVFGIRLSKK